MADVKLNDNKTIDSARLVDTLSLKARLADPTYANDIPLASETTLNATIQALTDPSNAVHLTTFYNLLAQVGYQNIYTPTWSDPLTKHFFKGHMETGSVVQNIVLPLLTTKGYRFDNAQNVFSFAEPDMSQYFGVLNRKEVTPLTISIPEIRRILTQHNGVEQLYNRIMGLLQTTVERNNTQYIYASLRKAVSDGKVTYIEVGDLTDENSIKKMIAKMRSTAKAMQWIDSCRKYNAAGMNFPTRYSDMVTLITQDAQATFETEVLASSFNRNDATLMGTIEEVPSIDRDGNVIAMMMDKEFLQVYSYLDETASNNNAATLTEHIYRHIWNSYTYVSAFNCVVFVKKLPENVPTFRVFPEDSQSLITTPGHLGKSFVMDVINTTPLSDSEVLVAKFSKDSNNLVELSLANPGTAVEDGFIIQVDEKGQFKVDVKYTDREALKALGYPSKITITVGKYTKEGTTYTSEGSTQEVIVNIYPDDPTTASNDSLTPRLF